MASDRPRIGDAALGRRGPLSDGVGVTSGRKFLQVARSCCLRAERVTGQGPGLDQPRMHVLFDAARRAKSECARKGVGGACRIAKRIEANPPQCEGRDRRAGIGAVLGEQPFERSGRVAGVPGEARDVRKRQQRLGALGARRLALETAFAQPIEGFSVVALLCCFAPVEVTTARFREFARSGNATQQAPPPEGSGAHPRIAATGWNTVWNSSLAVTSFELDAQLVTCSVEFGGTYASAEPRLPATCVSWYEAFAFCAAAGGRLPTESEWVLAASGGEGRVYPWSVPSSSTLVDDQHVNSCLGGPSSPGTPNGFRCGAAELPVMRVVGSMSPTGDGRWGHSDMAGNAAEHVLDWFTDPPPSCTADDCADLRNNSSVQGRVVRGGSAQNDPRLLRNDGRAQRTPSRGSGAEQIGFRCAHD